MRIAVLRGDKQEQLRPSAMGSWNRASHVSIGGSCSRVNEDSKDETVRQ
jgi:hypothetical protein